jgi:hypothetical protein
MPRSTVHRIRRVEFEVTLFAFFRPLAPTSIALKLLHLQCVAAMFVGERVRERGRTKRRSAPLPNPLPMNLPSEIDLKIRVVRGKFMGRGDENS